MCGIVGFTHKDWSPPPDRIRNATSTLIHRGPDQLGVYESQICSMGATRLKILDLEHGDQPIATEDGDTVIVFNGEIYNHLEVRAELDKLGHRFHTHCDTETVLRAFLEWDTECFRRLRGMFAVALWTNSTRRLVLARDRVGIKPLYIAYRGKEIFFGSELKAIFAHPEVERRLSLAGLDCYLSLNYVPAPWTLVDGIEKLLPGHWLEWRDGQVCSEAYWRLPDQIPRQRSLASACEELDSLLQRSLREHLLSDVPLGVWLSGGIDSSTILHYASQVSSSRLKTFSISFRGRSFDETSYIQQAVKEYGTEHEQLDLNPELDLQGAIEEFAYYSDEPSADAGALPVWFLSKLCKTRTTVALSGEGADELFAGYLTYRANAFARSLRKFPPSGIALALAGLRLWPVSNEKISFEYQLKRLLEGSLMPAERAHVYWNGTFSKAEKRSLVSAKLPPALDQILGELREMLSARKQDLGAYLWFDQKYYLPDDILVKSDRMSMAHAVELRPPFLDHRIVEFAATLPASLKIRGSQQKFLLKELMRDKLPQSILKRKKIGFDIPAHEWVRGPLRSLVVDTLHNGLSDYPEIFNSDVIENYLRDHLEKRINVGYHLWGLMVLFLWMKKWAIQVPAPSTAAHLLAPAGVTMSI
ncbi:MAG: asparagine synthase (glutamine-hydrolyzing) [Candidatus Korobacteraceae bacterium]